MVGYYTGTERPEESAMNRTLSLLVLSMTCLAARASAAEVVVNFDGVGAPGAFTRR
jgi:hypothetical protein